ncbi:hypothetical protein B0H66DRAFT_626546 [Apodospora peruviana]|uniref:Uncharacterized protein n=1 Tax=Apodospora peruviana TaxID=516989 RepID=A0AAE0M2I3_9PEZI|nr:hypothetical protein B0H66DRAFT_626546 [Apodospora peruviana]
MQAEPQGVGRGPVPEQEPVRFMQAGGKLANLATASKNGLQNQVSHTHLGNLPATASIDGKWNNKQQGEEEEKRGRHIGEDLDALVLLVAQQVVENVKVVLGYIARAHVGTDGEDVLDDAGAALVDAPGAWVILTPGGQAAGEDASERDSLDDFGNDDDGHVLLDLNDQPTSPNICRPTDDTSSLYQMCTVHLASSVCSVHDAPPKASRVRGLALSVPIYLGSTMAVSISQQVMCHAILDESGRSTTYDRLWSRRRRLTDGGELLSLRTNEKQTGMMNVNGGEDGSMTLEDMDYSL